MALLDIPNVEAPPGGFYGGYKAANELAKNNLENTIYEAEAKYAEQNALANALSKTAYAQYAPANAIASLLSGPAATNLSKEQYSTYADMLQNYLKNPSMPNMMQQPPGGGGLVGGLMGLLLNKIGAGQGQQQTQPVNQIGQAPVRAQNQQNQIGNPPVVSQPISQAGYGTATAQQALGQIPSNVPGAGGPAAAIQRGIKAAETAAIGQTETQNLAWREAVKGARSDTRVATDLHNAIVQFDTNYKASRIKGPGTQQFNPYGPIAGILNAFGFDVTSEQLAASGKTDILTLLAPLRNEGHITDANYELLSGIKIDPAMTPKAEQIMVNSMNSAVERMQEYLPFLNQIRRNNPDILQDEAEDLWRLYNRQYPPFDKSNQKLNPQYVDKWDNFASPQALSQLRETGRYKAPEIKEQNNKTPKTFRQKLENEGIDFPNNISNDQQFSDWFNNQSQDIQNIVVRIMDQQNG